MGKIFVMCGCGMGERAGNRSPPPLHTALDEEEVGRDPGQLKDGETPKPRACPKPPPVHGAHAGCWGGGVGRVRGERGRGGGSEMSSKLRSQVSTGDTQDTSNKNYSNAHTAASTRCGCPSFQETQG